MQMEEGAGAPQGLAGAAPRGLQGLVQGSAWAQQLGSGAFLGEKVLKSVGKRELFFPLEMK